MPVPDLILLAHAVATLWMCGVIAFVHRVHYPLFDRYARDGCGQTMRTHQARTGPVVGPPMLVELVTGIGLLLAPPAGVAAWQAWAGLALIGVVWACTALGQIPQHRRLLGGFDADAHRRLVSGNRGRTVAWLARGALVTWMLAGRLAAG